MQQFDIVVIGGGLVGATFARAVSGLGLSTLVLDHAPIESLYSQNLDNRGLALSYTTKQILQELQCWEKISNKSYIIETVHVSEQQSFGFTKLEAKTYNLDALGYVVSASDLASAIIGDLEDLSDITVLRPVIITSIDFSPTDRNWTVCIGETKITAKLIIAANGCNSMLHKLQNIAIHQIDMQQSAVVTNLTTMHPMPATAYERFNKNGVLAILPFGSYRAKCVFTGADSYIQTLKNCSDVDFLYAIQNIIGYRVGKFISVTERKIFPVQHCYAETIYSECMILLGNAANTLHPIAAQGFNLGVRDAITLSKILHQTILNGHAINDASVLEKYAALRASDHVTTRNFTHKLVDIFSDPRILVRLYRRLGIVSAQLIPAFNKKIVQQGLGA